MAQTASPDVQQYTTQYELLRLQVIGSPCGTAQPDAAGQTRGAGLARLLGEGMPGWLKAIEAVICASVGVDTSNAAEPAKPQHSAGYMSAPAWLSGVPRDDLTALLVSLVLSTRHVERSSPMEGYRPCH